MKQLQLMYITNPMDLNVTVNDVKKYLKAKELDPAITKILDECGRIVFSEVTPKAVYSKIPIKITKETVDFGFMKVWSQSLSDHMRGCNEAFVVAATLGVSVDRLVERYIRIFQAKALVCDAIGSALIEAFCDKLDKLLISKKETVTRFSPGYGDFDISYQKNIIEFLEADKKVGITLTDSMMMVPSKSVTAIIGLKKW